MYPSLDGAYPIVGHLPEMYRRFPSLCARGQRAHGALFYVEGGPGARQLMCADDCALAALKQPEVSTSFYEEGFGPLLSNTLFAFDGDEHRRVRGLMAPAFTRARLRRSDVVEIVDEVVGAALAEWLGRRRLRVLAATREIALRIILRVLGVATADVATWRKQFNRYLLAGLPTGRGPVQWLARRGRDWLDARLGDSVDRLRARRDDRTLVGAIANSEDERGQLLDRGLVVANLRLLVLAGHETTAAALAWNVLHLAAGDVDRARAADEVAGGRDLCALAGDGDEFTFAEAQLRESLRLYPSVHSLIRRVTRSVELPVGTIPAGTLLNVPLVHFLRDGRRYPHSGRYAPDRWAARPRTGTVDTAMFGGGPHFCLGYHVAVLEGTLFNLKLARALSASGARLRLLQRGPLPAPIYLPLAHPPPSLAVDLC